MSNKNIYVTTIVSIALLTFTAFSFASDNTQQVAVVSQKIQFLQEQLNSVNQKIEKLCDSAITKNTNSRIDVSKIH